MVRKEDTSCFCRVLKLTHPLPSLLGVARFEPLHVGLLLPLLPLLLVLLVQGEASLQNLLEMACTSLRAVPEYGNREVW